jgi:O-antigen/teichoic acid export membrane protein
VPDLLLRLALGPDFERASSALLLLGLAMSLLALVNLGSQYMLALFRHRFLFLLAAVVAVEPVLLASAPSGLESFAAMVLVAQGVAAAGMLVLCVRIRTSAARPEDPGPGLSPTAVASGLQE